MCVKLPSRDLNPDPYPPHPTNIYTYKVITAPKVCSDYSEEMLVFCFLFFVFFFFNILPEYSGYLLSTTLHMPNGELSLLLNKCMIRKQTKPGLLTWIRQLLALKQGTETYAFLN